MFWEDFVFLLFMTTTIGGFFGVIFYYSKDIEACVTNRLRYTIKTIISIIVTVSLMIVWSILYDYDDNITLENILAPILMLSIFGLGIFDGVQILSIIEGNEIHKHEKLKDNNEALRDVNVKLNSEEWEPDWPIGFVIEDPTEKKRRRRKLR